MPRLGGALDIVQVSDPATPAAGRQFIYFKSDGALYIRRPDTTIAAVVTTDTAQTIAGIKTFTAIPVVPNASFGVATINATGVASATTYLRGDGSWATPAGGAGAAPTFPSLEKFRTD